MRKPRPPNGSVDPARFQSASSGFAVDPGEMILKLTWMGRGIRVAEMNQKQKTTAGTFPTDTESCC